MYSPSVSSAIRGKCVGFVGGVFFFFPPVVLRDREMDEIEQTPFSGTKTNSKLKQIPAWSSWPAHGRRNQLLLYVCPSHHKARIGSSFQLRRPAIAHQASLAVQVPNLPYPLSSEKPRLSRTVAHVSERWALPISAGS